MFLLIASDCHKHANVITNFAKIMKRLCQNFEQNYSKIHFVNHFFFLTKNISNSSVLKLLVNSIQHTR